MHWIAPSETDTDNAALEKRLWTAAERAVPAPRSTAENVGVHGLEGDPAGRAGRDGCGNVNSYYDDSPDATGRFDFVLAA